MKRLTRERQIITAARVASMVFTPFYLPMLGLVVLFFLSSLSQYPLDYKFYILAVVYFFTILLPTFLIHLYRRYQGWTLIELGSRERRIVPYVISILCYFTCLYIFSKLIPDKENPTFCQTILIYNLRNPLFKSVQIIDESDILLTKRCCRILNST